MENSISTLPPTLDVKMAASYLCASTQTIKRRIASGQLRAYKDGGYWKIKREWLLEYEQKMIEKADVDQLANTV